MNSGWKAVTLLDNDEELLQVDKTVNNIRYTSSQSELPYDLHEDVLGFRIETKTNCRGKCSAGYHQIGTKTSNNDVGGACLGQHCHKTLSQCAALCESTPGCISYMYGPPAQHGHCSGLCELCNHEKPNNSWGTELYFCKKMIGH